MKRTTKDRIVGVVFLLVLILAAGLMMGAGTSINGSRTLQSTLNFCADAGVSDAYACNMAPALQAYVSGACYTFKANTANTGAATVAFNGLSAITIVKVAGGITTALADNDIRAGQYVNICYDGTNMQLQSILGNAPLASPINLATQVTGLLGNGNYYGTLKSQRIATAETTASGTYVALTTPETITFVLAATTTVVATYTAQCAINFVTSETFNIILVDGSQVATTEQLTDITSANFNQVCNATYSGSLASGSHTIAVQHKMFVATTTTGTWSNRLLMAYASP